MSHHSKLQALRNLAERPGTEAEGIAARAALKRLEAKGGSESDALESYRQFIRTGNLDDLATACGSKTCACGTRYPSFTECFRFDLHQKLRAEIESRFPRGSRVFYNRWAYPPNCPGKVAGYGLEWNWIRIKFDHLKSTRSCQAYSLGWHIFTEPVEYEELRRMNIRDGMESFERQPEGVA